MELGTHNDIYNALSSFLLIQYYYSTLLDSYKFDLRITNKNCISPAGFGKNLQNGTYDIAIYKSLDLMYDASDGISNTIGIENVAEK
jgi:hypothetical protein